MSTQRISMRGLFLLGLLAPLAGCATTRCADFEDLTPQTAFHVGDTITSQQISFPVESFRLSEVDPPEDGNAVVTQFGGTAPAIGLELRGTSIQIPLAGAVDHVQMHFIRMGGLASLGPHGSVMPWDVGTGISGLWTSPGGVIFVDARQYAAPSGQLHNWAGTLTIAAPVQSFQIGGQELWLDDVCICADDCTDGPVDNGAMRFAALGNEVVQEERRLLPLNRLGHRAFQMTAVTLPHVSVPEGATLTVTVAVHHSRDLLTFPIVSATRTVSGTLAEAPVTVPLAFTFPQRNIAAIPPPDDIAYNLYVYVHASGADATIETVAPTDYPYCEATGRFSFSRALRALGTGYVLTNGAPFHVRLEGTCQ